MTTISREMKSLEYDFPEPGEFSVMIQRPEGAATELLIGHHRNGKWDFFDYQLNTIVPTDEESAFAESVRLKRMA